MWRFLKHWRDWTSNELRPLLGSGPQVQAMHFSYEKAGLQLRDTPVPWNADSLQIEAIMRLPASARRKSDFTLLLPGRLPLSADNLKHNAGIDRYHVLFRWNGPILQSVAAELRWRHRSLGSIPIPVVPASDFLAGLSLDLPTVSVRLGRQTVACSTFVARQCRALHTSVILTSRTCALAAIGDMGLHVQFASDREGVCHHVPIPLSSSQLQHRQALVTASLPIAPKRCGRWTVSWRIGSQTLACEQVSGISRRQFHQSLRLCDARFVAVDAKGQFHLRRQLPLQHEMERLGPCFFVSSQETGVAGRCVLQMRLQHLNADPAPLVLDQEVLITDGPTPFAPGMLSVAELGQATAFELRHCGRVLGALPLSPVPMAKFTSEGGYLPPTDFVWTSAADEELAERLQRLMNEKS